MKFRIYLAAGLTLLLLLSGCSSHELSLQELQNKVASAIANTSTVKSQQETSEILSISVNGTAGQSSALIATYSETNYSEKQYYSSFEIKTQSDNLPGGLQPSSQTGVRYVMGNWGYFGNSASDGPYRWTKLERSFSDAQELGHQLELLQSAGQNTVVGKEELDGNDCFLVQIDTDAQHVIDWLHRQILSQLGSAELSMLNEQDVESFIVKQWISASAFLPLRMTAEVSLDIALQPAQITDGNSRDHYEINVESRFFDFGKPLTIELPPEAQSASEPSPK